MKRKTLQIEVLPAVREASAPASVGAALEELVHQKVAEVLASKEDLLLEPWFRSRREAQELRRLQTVQEQRRWSVYFEKWGCVRCNRKRRPHAGNGMCSTCRVMVQHRLNEIIRELTGQKEHPQPRSCSTCGQQFSPRTNAEWEFLREKHEQGKRHKLALRKLRRQIGGRIS